MKVSREKFAYLHTCTEARKKINLEIRLAFRSVILISKKINYRISIHFLLINFYLKAGFLISWTPYAFVCLYKIFFDGSKVRKSKF